MKSRNLASSIERSLRGAAVLPLAFLLLGGSRALAADTAPLKLMPLPKSVVRADGALVVTPHTGLSSFTVSTGPSADARLTEATQRFLAQLDRTCGGDIRRANYTPATGTATLTITSGGPGNAIQSVDEDESYKLTVTPTSATLTAPNDLGALHGLQTILQLATLEDGACVLPAVTIDDAPRFAWRGYMVDVSRHFEPVDEIKRTLDGMAMVKLNVFHWHLSDDQGFRAESKKFPKLTSVGSGGQFYTQEQMRDVVAYARARGIRVVPEFDMPGHSTSWILAYPEFGAAAATSLPVKFGIPQAELDPSNEKTLKFIDELVGEMGEIFPDVYFHIGGDEVEGKGWLANPHVVEFMKKKGFAKPDDLQAYFNQRLLAILTKHHKRMIGWDEILKPELPKDIVVESWRGEESLSAGAVQGYTGILAAPYYLDAEKTSEMMFLADPIPSDTKLTPGQQKLILGGEATMWAEQLFYETIDSRVWPRTAAIAERFWSPQSDRDVADMYRRLRLTSLELEDVGLTHLTGPEKLRRNLTGSADPGALDVLASVVEPVSFGERYDEQRTDGLVTLDRLVDAVVADPPSRQEIANEVDAVLAAPAGSAAAGELRAKFAAWQTASAELAVWAARSPRLSDIGPRAQQLGELGAAGLQALDYLQTGTTPPDGWKTAQLALLAEAGKNSALVRFTFLPSLQKLVEAAGH